MKKKKRYRLLPYITIILLVTTFMILCNFCLFSYKLNIDSYKRVEAVVTKQGYDGLFSFVPKIYVSYNFDNVDYDAYFFDYNTWIFNTRKIGDSCCIYVNVKSPPNIIFFHDFWDSYINLGFFTINSICTVIILVNIIRSIIQYVRRRKERISRKQGRREEEKEVQDKLGEDIN